MGYPVSDMSPGELAAAALRRAGFVMERGLSSAEVAELEHAFGLLFGEDHRDFLAAGVPVGQWWVDWRGDRRSLAGRIDEPIIGVLAHVVPGGFWPSDWGLRPGDEGEALRIAEAQVRTWPKLTPIYSHRFSIGGALSGSAVLSASGTDVIEYGPDIAFYVSHEFGLEPLAISGFGSSSQVDLVYPWLSLDHL